MIAEALFLVAAWHPGHEDDYNAVTPGVFLSVSTERHLFTPTASVGAYVDSYRKVATMAGVGCDVGYDYGVGLTIAHVTGSDLEDYLAVPIPSLFLRSGNHGIRILCAPDATAFAFGYTYAFGQAVAP